MSDYDDIDLTHSVYRIFDAQDRLLYIGCARNVGHRIYMHRLTYTMGDAAWVIHRHYARHTSVEYGTKDEARAAERAAIEAEAPLLNRQHNPTRWRRIDGEYRPITDETVDLLNELNARPEPDPEFARLFDELFGPRLRSAS